MTESTIWLRLFLAIVATWRVTHLLAKEDGPADVVVRVRTWLGESLLGKLMDCFYCLSLWVAAPAALFVTRSAVEWIFCWLAVSGAACLLERLGPEPVVIQPVTQSAEGGNYDVLRSETHGSERQSDARSEEDYCPTHLEH